MRPFTAVVVPLPESTRRVADRTPPGETTAYPASLSIEIGSLDLVSLVARA
jgi:hypothetical protein